MKPKTINPDKLTPRKLSKYNDSLEVLRLMRKGVSFNKATKSVGISPGTTKKLLGSSIFKRKNRIIPKKTDSLLRSVLIYENGKQIFIQIKGTKNVKTVGQYHNAVGKRIDNNEKFALLPFTNKKIRDSKGKIHSLETDVVKIQEIFERREEPEFFTIYKQGGSFK